jgi:hypothetical protein
MMVIENSLQICRETFGVYVGNAQLALLLPSGAAPER